MAKKRDMMKAGKWGFHTEGTLALSVSRLSTDDELPIQRFKKDLIYEGLYIHPVYEWELHVDLERMEKWVIAFAEMSAAGVDVEVVVDHSYSADDVRGYLKDMFIEDALVDGEMAPVLFGIFEMRGDKGIELAKTVKNVSIAVERNFVDGKGNGYGEVIEHIGIVQKPIVPDQDEFVPIAASGKAVEGVPIMVRKNSEKGSAMNKELLEKLSKILGKDVEVTEDNAADLMLSKLGEFQTANTELGDKVKKLEASMAETKANGQTEKMPEDLAEEIAANQKERLSALVEQGNITPAQKEKLEASFVGKAGARNVRCLSVKHGVENKSVLSTVIDILKMSAGPEKGEKTRGQSGTKELSRQADGDGGDDSELAGDMVKEAGLKVEKTD